MKHIVIVPYDGGSADGLFLGIREFPTERVILLVAQAHEKDSQKIKNELNRFKVPVDIHLVKDENSLEEVFELFNLIRAQEKGKDLLVNVGVSSGTLSCAALSASFVNGLKAFEMMDNRVLLFPILKFSYYDMLSDRKLDILRCLLEKESFESLESLSKKLKMGPSLLQYHVYGQPKNPGLQELGLIDVNREKGKIRLGLTSLGKLLMKAKN